MRQARPARLAGHAQRRRYIGRSDPDITAPRNRRDSSSAELQRMIDALRNHPSHRHVGAVQRRLGPVRHRRASPTGSSSYDPTRLVNSASGWTDRGVGDVHDMHIYPGPGMRRRRGQPGRGAGRVRRPGPAGRRPHLAGEEELGLPRAIKNAEELTDAYRRPDREAAPADRRRACPPPSTPRPPTSRSRSTAS